MNSYLGAFALGLAALLSPVASQLAVGDQVCVEGYLMDVFCIDLGTLFDNPSLGTLSAEGPPAHSVHCLIDAPPCIGSPFEILLPNTEGDDFIRGWRLDDTTKELAVTLAKAQGICTDCDGTGTIERGFYIAITAQVTDLGDADRPPMISATMADSVSIGSPEALTCAGGSAYPPVVANQVSPTDAEVTVLDTGLTLETVDNGDNTATFTVTYEGTGWVALGVSPTAQMVGSQAVIALPGSGQAPQIYDLNAKAPTGVVPAAADDQILTSSSFTQANGVTTLVFTVPLDATTAFSVSSSGDTGFIYAFGSSNELAYHAGRGVFTSAVGGGGGEAPVPASPVDEPAPVVSDPVDEAAEALAPLQVGDQVCVEGYLMDLFCINRGTLFDNQSVETLSAEGPMVHSVHCLIDVPQCIGTPFEILLPNMEGDSDDFIRGWRLDDTAKDLAVSLAKAQGICTDCDGTGTIERGLYIALTAQVVDLGDATRPPIITATMADSVSIGSPEALTCAGGSAYPPAAPAQDDAAAPATVQVGDQVCIEGYLMDLFCINRGTLFDNQSVETLSAEGPMVHSVHCLIDVPQCIGTPFEILLPNTEGDDFIRGWRLDDSTKDAAVALAKTQGICTDCDGTGTIERGLYIALTAQVVDLGDATRPPIIAATMADSVSIGSPDALTCAGGSAYPPAAPAQDDAAAPATAQVGDQVCIEGYLMDLFCINRGTLFDNQSVETLSAEGPMVHSVHCLIDVPQCIGTPFEILLPNTEGDDFIRGWRLDDSTKDAAVALAKTQGICTDCDGTGTIERGLYVSLTAEVVDAGDSTRPALVTAVGDVAIGSPDMLTCAGGSAYPPPVLVEEAAAPAPAPGLMVLEQGLTLESVDNGDNTATYTLVYQGEGWVGLGVSPTGQMLGSQAVLGIFGAGTPLIYNLDSRLTDGIVPAPDEEQILLSAECMQENGVTTLMFTVPLDATTPFSVSAAGETGFIYAFGETNELAYHKSRGSFSSSLQSGPQVGDEFCVEGYLMDVFCINRGTLFDNPDVVTLSLEGPPVHSIKCMIDVPDCLASPFEILLQPLPGENMYQRGWRLDDDAKAQAVELAKLVGSCDACSGTQVNNFYVSMTGTMLDTGTADNPPTISVQGMNIVSGDPEQTCEVLTRPPAFPSTGEQDPLPTAAGTISLEPGFTLETVDNGDNTATFTLEYTGEGWIGLGVSQSGAMVGSQAVIALPDSGDPPMIYDLTSPATAGIVPAPSDQQILTDASVTQEGGTTTLTYTVPLDATTPYSVASSGSTGYIYAYGSSNELAYHAKRGTISASIGGGAAPEPEPLQVGDQVCVEGYLMDQFCINRGTLFDNQSVETLSAGGPPVHSVHCLIDVPQCIATPFEILLPNTEGDDFIRGWLLDDSTKNAAVALAKAQGICTDCDGGGSIERGFYIALPMAEIVDLGDANRPPLITMVDGVSVGSPEALTCPKGSAYPPPPADEVARGGTPSGIISLEPGFTLQTVDNGDTATFTLNYEGEGWIGIGVSPSGSMVGSQAVIALPDSGDPPMIYDLTSQATAGIVRAPSDQQILTDASVTQADGITTLTYTVPLEASTPFFISASGDTGYIYAYGSSNELAYHARRGAIKAPLQGEAMRIDASGRYKAHGWIMSIAWGILVPLAVGASMLRDLLPGTGTFFKIHRALNTLALVMVLVGFALAVDAVQMEGLPHFTQNKHRTTGLVIFIFALVQGIMGYCRPHLPQAPPDDADANADGAAASDAEQGDLVPKTERPKAAEEKSTARKAFEVGHRFIGFGLLGTAWWNCVTGIQFFNIKFPDMADPNLTSIFMGVAFGLAGVIFLVWAGNTVRKMDKSS